MLDWIWIFIKGVGFGVALAFLIGPAFFTLIQTSIKKGFAAGVGIALGISSSDAIYITVSYIGVSRWAGDDHFKAWFGLLGGAVMLGFGIISLMKRVEEMLPRKEKNTINKISDKKGLFGDFMKGFLLNGLNPFLFMFWVGIVGSVANHNNYTPNQTVFFFCCIIAALFSMDLTKVHLANKLSHIVTPKLMRTVNRVVGIALIVYSFRLFFSVYEFRNFLMF
ncbi:hypothetical protein FUAX_27300 [Fulvitalea axinellae]|uniref:Threonine/homoserine/homoserine lactone efflux protein n=1 Tax=Fulvitalea axinellae TaxID=1182444 RepID=A0AAU9D2W3_9BACT|nr:hypothetical protein FUAX_27300 [Fulvitalea axinellae]